MTETSTAKRQVSECPFDSGEIESAKAVYLKNPHWKNVYANAPSGAKRRLEVAFWFSQTRDKWPGDKAGEILSAYRAWRNDIETAMTCGELEYMVAVIDKLSAKEHYAALLKDRKSGLRTSRGRSRACRRAGHSRLSVLSRQRAPDRAEGRTFRPPLA
jgi:hypothetical protein